MSGPIERRYQRQCRARKKAQTGITQRPRLGGALPRMPRRTTVADIDNGNRWKRRAHDAKCRCFGPSARFAHEYSAAKGNLATTPGNTKDTRCNSIAVI